MKLWANVSINLCVAGQYNIDIVYKSNIIPFFKNDLHIGVLDSIKVVSVTMGRLSISVRGKHV